MIYIKDQDIEQLNISPSKCIQWVTEDFKMKYASQLPAKVSVYPSGNDFITTMPCLLPADYHTFGVKIVARVTGRKPSLESQVMLYDSQTSQLKAILDSNWITSMRTGAVASLAIKTFRRKRAKTYSLIGLGNTAHATIKCLSTIFADETIHIRLFRYKDQAETFIEEFSAYQNLDFEIVDTMEDLIVDTDVLISCITNAQGLLMKDNSAFKPGILLVPVHMRGFQNCDLFFDKVFADDTNHVKGFKYFNQFKKFGEISDVLLGNIPGRENETERIISYNIGLGLHDVYFSYQIYQILKGKYKL